MRVGDAVVHMNYFPASDSPPKEVCEDGLKRSDIYLLIAGLRHGSVVPGSPGLSYVDLEFRAAAEMGLPRLAFLIAEDPAGDGQAEPLQAEFRERVKGSGITASLVGTPDQLELAIVQTLLTSQAVKLGYHWNLPRRTRFVGHERVVAQLFEAFRNLPDSGAVAVLCGMPGIGKTTCAVEYASRNSRALDIAWLVPAGEAVTIESALVDLAVNLGLSEESDPPDKAIAKLRNHLRTCGRWLIIFDDAQDLATLNRYILEGPGSVIVTSRDPSWFELAEAIRVDELEENEAVKLLTSYAEISSVEAAGIVDGLGGVPLALSQAGTFIAETAINPATYVDLLAGRTRQLMARGRHSPHDRVATQWDIAFEELEAASVAAMQLLEIIAWLGAEDVPLAVLVADHSTLPEPLARAVSDPILLADSVGLLQRRGMILTKPGSMNLHRLPARIIRERQLERVGKIHWQAITIKLIRHSLPRHVHEDPKTWAPWRKLVGHALAVVEHDQNYAEAALDAVWLLRNSAFYLEAQGLYGEALARIREACTLASSQLHPGSDELLDLENDYGIILRSCGELDEALRRHEHVYELTAQRYGHEHPEALDAEGNVATDLRFMGEFERARNLDSRLLEIRTRVLGGDHPGTLVTASNLAIDLYSLGQHEQARELESRTLELSRVSLGSEHPDTIGSMNNLGAFLRATGQHADAVRVQQEALVLASRVFGEDSTKALHILSGLARSLYGMGRFEDARTIDEKVLDCRIAISGEEDESVIRAARNLLDDLHALQDDAAVELLRDRIALLEQKRKIPTRLFLQ